MFYLTETNLGIQFFLSATMKYSPKSADPTPVGCMDLLANFHFGCFTVLK